MALRKAVQLGLPGDAIRSAILAHAEKVDDHRGLRMGLGTLKQKAVEQGVLRAGDLPNVLPPAKSFAEQLQRVKQMAEEEQTREESP